MSSEASRICISTTVSPCSGSVQRERWNPFDLFSCLQERNAITNCPCRTLSRSNRSISLSVTFLRIDDDVEKRYESMNSKSSRPLSNTIETGKCP
ncbi:hypothetical protein EJB05_25713 [Eragrostis curvula]|uniref:Uncharacterized protein n=1 Tax=Eragrostis curvula TaxID=38414 RepID=A0A5J9UIP1_9POAL|nr:hypothetical protein EJB05_25713 [Eragrostis curvula]